MSEPTLQSTELAPLRRFLLPSLIGAIVFLCPIYHDGAWTILLGVAADALRAAIGDAMPALLLGIVTLSALLTIAGALSPNLQARYREHGITRVFSVPLFWIALRLLSTLCAWLIVFKVGPEFVWNEYTGAVALFSLGGTIVTIFLCASFLLPMLTDYGLMEFFGTLLQPLFRRLFTLPGRAAVDALASWLAAAAVGVLITISQYEQGHYSRREAIVIATNFSVTSLPFCLFVIEFIGLREHFFSVYATIVIIGLCCAILLPRLPPLRGIRPLPGETTAQEKPIENAEGVSLLSRATSAARKRAASGPNPTEYLATSAQHVMDIWMGLVPLVVLIGTLGLALAEFTPVMQILSAPLIPVLEWFGLPDARAAAPTFMVGFLDMFLPAAIGQGVESELTRFVIAAVSLTQLIYLSEVGSLLLRSALKVNVLTLLSIFVMRTLVGFPIAVVAAKLFMA
ncbi:MAG: nucleoside recognition membrane protein YjiH [Glaciecola sp.]|jgi:nucleoside recognition membrane protein YjiH|uniref:YjiH family protein n=1 Tax=Congregibacter sp. TaxID=2744308 RepID=UPI0039E3874B